MEELKTIKQTVEEVLKECPNARNSDKLLTILVFRKLGFKIWIEDLNNSPSFESIRRSRQKIQTENILLQPTENVKELREIQKENYKEVFR
jgi:predicted oxidoreductase (fatty acid repression mutant protein)